MELELDGEDLLLWWYYLKRNSQKKKHLRKNHVGFGFISSSSIGSKEVCITPRIYATLKSSTPVFVCRTNFSTSFLSRSKISCANRIVMRKSIPPEEKVG